MDKDMRNKKTRKSLALFAALCIAAVCMAGPSLAKYVAEVATAAFQISANQEGIAPHYYIYYMNGDELVETGKGLLGQEEAVVTDTVPEKEGYQFLGWAEDPAATVAEYTAGSTIPLDGEEVVYRAVEKYLYAVWGPGKEYAYSLEYVSLDDSYVVEGSVPEGQYATSPDKSHVFTVSSTRPDVADLPWEFQGWSTNPDATVPEYVGGDPITLNVENGDRASVTLYAVCTVRQQLLFIGGFDSDDGDTHIEESQVTGMPETVDNIWNYTQVGSMTFRIPSDVPGTDGYTFVCWVNETGRNEYAEGMDFSNITDENKYMPEEEYVLDPQEVAAGGYTLYAIWEKAGQSFILETGAEFNRSMAAIMGVDSPSDISKIQFSDETAPDNVTLTDVSAARDGSVVAWSDGYALHVSTQKAGVSVIFNSDCSTMFKGFGGQHLTGLDFVDTSNVENMSQMFMDCIDIDVLDLSGWDVSNVTNMQQMFYGDFMLTKITGLASWKTSKVETMAGMFGESSGLVTVEADDWDVSGVKNMDNMFHGCYGMEYLNLISWDVSNVTNMHAMFQGDEILSVDCSSWDVSKVIDYTDFDDATLGGVIAPAWVN